jgi:genome maintenance exonuclease 1
MAIIRPYDYKVLDRITHENGSRYYVSPEGDHLSSVTTILSATSYSPELAAWRERVGEKEANRIRDEATGLGSLMHTHLENHIQGIDRPKGNNIVRKLAESMADQVIHFGLKNIGEVWGMEEMLYYPQLYAGTADLIAMHNGVPAICDYKTTKKMKKRDSITDYYCQGAAYALAHNELFGTDIKKIVIFMVARDLKFEEYVVEGTEFDHYADLWTRRMSSFLDMQAKMALGNPNTDPTPSEPA